MKAQEEDSASIINEAWKKERLKQKNSWLVFVRGSLQEKKRVCARKEL